METTDCLDIGIVLGSPVSLYIGPKAPAGLESNWIPTQGKRPIPCFRLYGPTDAYFGKTFKLSDFELVK
jgi:hypothetical protein